MSRNVLVVPGGRLAVEDAGAGPPLLLIHAGVVDMRAWDPLVPLLHEAGYRTIWYDMRGYGQSTSDGSSYRGEADLLAVMDDRGIDRAVIVGNSMGAVLAIDAALEWPDRVAGIAWIGGGIGGFEVPASDAEEVAFERKAAALAAGDMDVAAEWNVRIWLDGVGQPTTRVPEDVRAFVRRMTRPLFDPDRVLGEMERPAVPAKDRLADLEAPVLALVGALDTTTTRASAQKLAREGRARLVDLGQVGHLPALEAPADVARPVLAFLDTIAGWSVREAPGGSR